MADHMDWYAPARDTNGNPLFVGDLVHVAITPETIDDGSADVQAEIMHISQYFIPNVYLYAGNGIEGWLHAHELVKDTQ